MNEEQERFWSKVDASGDCWEWMGGRIPSGYGRFFRTRGSAGKREVVAHRYSWETLVGPIPEAYEMDHLCRNRTCVNPDHLEPVTRRVNQRRGFGFAGKQFRKTHCKRGHPFDEANTYNNPRSYGRQCRACRAMHAREFYRTHH